MNAQQGAALSLTGGLFLTAAGSLYAYANSGKGRGNAAARDRAQMIQLAGALGTAAGAGVLLWPVLKSKFTDQPQGADGTQIEESGADIPFLPGRQPAALTA